MGRAPGARDSKQKHAPLQTQLKEDLSGTLRDGSKKSKKQAKQGASAQDEDADVVPAALSEKILRLAREQQEEDQEGSSAG